MSFPSCRRADPARRVSRGLYAYTCLGHLIPLYPLYGLLFADSGLDVAQISSLFALWSLTGIVLEVPSGVVADAVSRRTLLVLAPLLSGAGFALWTWAPSYPAFAVGFVLWGAQGALRSGALEALVYEELARGGAAERYATCIGRAATAEAVAVAVATAAGSPVLALGGFPLAGALSVTACVLCAAAALSLPEHRAAARRAPRAASRVVSAPVDVLRAGVREVRGGTGVRSALLLVPAVTVVWGVLDEYVPLLAVHAVTVETVPLLLLLVSAGAAAGGLLAGHVRRLPSRILAGILVASASALTAGAVLTGAGEATGMAGVALAFMGFQCVSIVADARLQDAVGHGARATVTSLAGLVTDLGCVALYLVYGAASVVASHPVIFAAFAAAYLPVACAIAGRTRGACGDRGACAVGCGHRRDRA